MILKSGLKKGKLFNGGQDKFILGAWKANCCNCGEIIRFDVSDCQYFMALDPSLMGKVLAEIKDVESKVLGDTIFYKVDGLPIHFFQKNVRAVGQLISVFWGWGSISLLVIWL